MRSTPGLTLSGNNLGQVVHTCASSPSSMTWYRSRGVVTPCGWEGNRRSGIALAMHHRLRWFVHQRAHGLRKGDDHPAYTPHGVSHTLPLPEDDIYGAIIMAQSHCKISPGSSDECRLSTWWPPTFRQSQSTWAVSPPKTDSYHPHSPSTKKHKLYLAQVLLST